MLRLVKNVAIIPLIPVLTMLTSRRPDFVESKLAVPDQAFWHLLGGHDQELTKTRCNKHVSTRFNQKKHVDLSNVKWDFNFNGLSHAKPTH
jgi:hypothetical protein